MKDDRRAFAILYQGQKLGRALGAFVIIYTVFYFFEILQCVNFQHDTGIRFGKRRVGFGLFALSRGTACEKACFSCFEVVFKTMTCW